MSTQLSVPSIGRAIWDNIKKKTYEGLTGKAAPGTFERQATDLAQNRWLEALRKEKTLTPQEEREGELDFQRRLTALQQESGLKGMELLAPVLLGLEQGRTSIQNDAYSSRMGVNTEAASRLRREQAAQQGALTRNEYDSYASNFTNPAFALQDSLSKRSDDRRGDVLQFFRERSQADDAFRNRYLDYEQQQSGGIKGFLNALLPAAGLALTAASVFRG